jgi:hypothetical protein
VPQVGQATCGSFGSRQFGQAISCGAVAFHCARRDLVLLRDILRFGTATSLLLQLIRHGVRPVCRHNRPGSPVRYFLFGRTAARLVAVRPFRPKVLQRRPRRAALLMAVAWLSVRQPNAALDAEALATVLAQRRERKLEHNSVAHRGLQVE